jgi:hypothetical protein
MSDMPFIRISWEEACAELTKSLNARYNVSGGLTFKKNYHSEGIGNLYEFPDFVDIYIGKKGEAKE